MTLQRFWLVGLCLWSGLMTTAGTVNAGETGVRFRATLIWGTNDPQPPNSKLRPVEPEVARKLTRLPFKWSHYYAVESKEFAVEEGGRSRASMSKECDIEVAALKNDVVELSLWGKGKLVGKATQKLSENQMMVTGGNAENMTSWLVVLIRVPDK